MGLIKSVSASEDVIGALRFYYSHQILRQSCFQLEWFDVIFILYVQNCFISLFIFPIIVSDIRVIAGAVGLTTCHFFLFKPVQSDGNFISNAIAQYVHKHGRFVATFPSQVAV